MVQDREQTLYAILDILKRAKVPLGSRIIAQRLLAGHSIDASESTVSRALRETDRLGLTVAVGRKGRSLTDAGLVQHERTRTALRASKASESIVRVHTVAQLIDLLRARHAVEVAVVQDIIRTRPASWRENSTDDLVPHAGESTLLDFHRDLAQMTSSPMLKLLSAIVLDPSLDHGENAVGVAVGTSLEHHAEIIAAISKQDPEAAVKAVDHHFLEMISYAERVLGGQNAAVLERLLEYMGADAGRQA